jgi:hypothetical protein
LRLSRENLISRKGAKAQRKARRVWVGDSWFLNRL